jgi:putative ABC transport system permease protein
MSFGQVPILNSRNMNHSPMPPRWPTKLLVWLADGADIEDLLGDLEEDYLYRKKHSRAFKANIRYSLQVLSLCFSYTLRKRRSQSAYSHHYHQNSLGMFQNYIKIALRNFSKHRLFTSLNIIGLALGMSICLLALSIAVAIYQSDEHNPNKDRLFQINTYIESQDLSKTYGSTFHALGYHLATQYSFIENIIKIKSGFQPEIDHFGNKMSFHGYFADETFISAFAFETIHGNLLSALSEPFSMVLTKSTADKLFKDLDPLGRLLATPEGDFTVTAVVADPKQTHLYFEVLTSFSTYEQLAEGVYLPNDWNHYRNNYVYTLLKKGASQNQLDQALIQASVSAEESNPNTAINFESIGLSQVVPRWNISNALGIGWDQPSMLFFMFIGLLILLPAIFNYINLSIARSLKRAKEIGIRKVVGADSGQIKAQFAVETVMITMMGMVGSLLIFIPLKDEFLQMVRAAEVLDTSMGIYQLLVFLIFTMLIGLIAGVFPARFFSRLDPVHTLKGQINQKRINVSGIKKGLFVFQFFLSLVFIIGVGTIARQYAYVLNSNHGFSTKQILTVELLGVDKQIALNELGQHPDVKAVTTTSSLPGMIISGQREITPNDVDSIWVKEVFIDENFIENLEMKLAWGNSDLLSQSNQTEEYVLVNQEFLNSVNVFNLKQDTLTFSLADGTHCRIVGILDEVNFEPLSELIQPMILRHSKDHAQYALLSISSADIKKTINELDAIWSTIDQDIPFTSSFLDAEIEKAYHFLQTQIKIFSFLSILAITISCLGLLGMVAYNTENRTKEIAVRKILGASERSLYLLLTRDFVKLILISAAFAVPFSYFFYDKVFLYFLIRYGLGLGVVEVLAGILFLFIFGFASIFWQTSKVARANPATKLRYE